MKVTDVNTLSTTLLATALCLAAPGVSRAATASPGDYGVSAPLASDGTYQGGWTNPAYGSYTPPGAQPADNHIPGWINTALTKAGLKAAGAGVTPQLVYQVFAPDQSSRIIVLLASPTEGCPALPNDPANTDPQACTLHVLTVHANGTQSAMTSVPACLWSGMESGNLNQFARDPASGRISARAIVNDQVVPHCSVSTTP